MPFKSDAQRRWMFATHPRMAKRWAEHTPKGADLPERVKKALDRLKQANGDEGKSEDMEPTIVEGRKIPSAALTTFFGAHPAPEDAQVHELADAYGTDPHTVEEQIYRMLGSRMNQKEGSTKVAYWLGCQDALRTLNLTQ